MVGDRTHSGRNAASEPPSPRKDTCRLVTARCTCSAGPKVSWLGDQPTPGAFPSACARPACALRQWPVPVSSPHTVAGQRGLCPRSHPRPRGRTPFPRRLRTREVQTGNAVHTQRHGLCQFRLVWSRDRPRPPRSRVAVDYTAWRDYSRVSAQDWPREISFSENPSPANAPEPDDKRHDLHPDDHDHTALPILGNGRAHEHPRRLTEDSARLPPGSERTGCRASPEPPEGSSPPSRGMNR